MLSIGESEDIRKIDISWRSGSVNIYAAKQSAQISVKEESTAPLAESEKMVCAIDGDTVSELTIETMSGEVTIGASSSGSN